MNRREVVRLLSLAAAAAVARLTSPGAAFATSRTKAPAWLREVAEACQALRGGDLTPLEWQSAIERTCREHPWSEIVQFVELDALLQEIELPPDRAAVRTVAVPQARHDPLYRGFGRNVFALARGRAIVPHGHSNMVSAHWIVRGSFHVRTFHRHVDRERGDGWLYLEPSLDREMRVGEVLTMSDDRDNVHWLVAQSEGACTFDVPVTGLAPNEPLVTPTNRYGMTFIDPDGAEPEGDLLCVPVLDAATCIARYGARDA